MIYEPTPFSPVLVYSRPLSLCYSLESACPSGLRSPSSGFACSYVRNWRSVCPSALVHSYHMAPLFPLDPVIHCYHVLRVCSVWLLHHAKKRHVPTYMRLDKYITLSKRLAASGEEHPIFFASNTTLMWGHAVAQLVEALRHKSEGRSFDSRWCYWNFSLT